MRAYVIRRLLLIIPTLILVSAIVFFAMQLIPGTAVEQMIAEQENMLSPGEIEALKENLGVNVPVYVQYGRWMSGLIRGDLGDSLWTGRPVTEDLYAKLPVSVELGVLAIIVALILALPIGVYSAVRQDTPGDYMARTFAILCISLPSFWLGTMVMVFPSVWWRWTPSMTYIPFDRDPMGNLGMFIIPSLIMGMFMSGTTMRLTRTMMLEVLRQDYVRTAWAKGLTERVVVMRHALKNALIPVVSMIGLLVAVLVGGQVVIEQIFCLPGVGRHLLSALHRRDFTIVSGINLFVAVFVLASNLIVDLTYAWLDPRVQYN